MEYKDWVDLTSFGAQLKKLNLPNGTSVPIVVVNDIELFNSKATHLSNFRAGAENDIPFETLPGNKKGREFNQPILFMTKSYQANGNTPYSIMPSLAKLLNIPLEEVKQLRKSMPENQVNSDIPYADTEKFTAITSSCYQAYSGNMLYAVKNATTANNLVDYAKDITDQQHGLFPKANISNIPFDTLDKFGLSTSIIGRAFLNPQDAKRNGFDLSDLTRISLEGEMSILPISINKDLSINYISNVSEVSQLAFSNFKWKDNINLINDYNALAAVHESSRYVLNTRPSAIQSPEQLNELFENISVTLQNFNQSNGVGYTHKPIKYFNKGVTTHLIKNDQGEWRYIEKDLNSKTDEPLTWSNYQKALTTIANYNAILSAALEMKVKTGAEFDNALQTVFKNHNQFYKANTQVVQSLDDVKPNGRLVIHENGKKIHKHKVAEATNVQRDMGESLYTESVKNLLAGMDSIQNAGDINNIVGNVVDDFTLKQTIEVVSDGSEHEDLGLTVLDQIAQGEKLDFKRAERIEKVSLFPVVDIAKYTELPKGISEKVDSNYSEVNDIYKSLQHIELSQIPYYQNTIESAKNEVNQLSSKLSTTTVASYEEYLKNGDAAFGESAENKALDSHNKLLNLHDSIEQYDQIIDRSRIQANILRYQFTKYLGDLDQPIYGALVLASDENGNYKPFEDATAYRTAVQLTKNAFEAQNVNGYTPRVSEVSANLDSFVSQHYVVTSVDASEPDNALVDLGNTLSAVQIYANPNIEVAESLPIPKLDMIMINDDILMRANYAFTKYTSGIHSEGALDKALVGISRYVEGIKRVSGYDFKPTNNAEFNKIIESFSAYKGAIDYPIHEDFRSPINGVVIGDMTKIEILKSAADKSLALLNREDGVSASLMSDYMQSSNAARLLARENIELKTEQEIAQNMAGKFLLNFQNSFKSNEQPSNNIYYFNVNGGPNSFKVNSAENGNIPDGAIKLSSANTLNVAVRHAFHAYQVHQIASDLGISTEKLSLIQEIASHIKNFEPAVVSELSKQAFGHTLSVSDLLSMKLIGASDEYDSSRNRLVSIECEDAGRILMTHDDSQKLLDQVGLCLKLSEVHFDMRLNPALRTLGSNVEFEKVQKYLMPDLEEHGKLSALIKEAESAAVLSKTMPEMMAAYASSVYQSARDSSILINPSNLAIASNLAVSEGDVVFTRVVPDSWMINTPSNPLIDFNVNKVLCPEGMVTKDALKGYISEQVSLGWGSRPSVPVLSKANAYANKSIEMTDIEKDVLVNGAAVIDGLPAGVEKFNLTYAVTNLQVALNNMPKDIVSEIHNANNDLVALSKIDIRVSITEPKDTTLPILKFESFNADLDPNAKYMGRINGGFVINILDQGGFDLKQLGEKPVVLSPNEIALSTNKMFLDRLGFDLQTYFDKVQPILNVEDLRVKNSLNIVDALPTITFAESKLSQAQLKHTAVLLEGILETNATADSSSTLSSKDIVNAAKIFIKPENSEISIALGQSDAKCAQLISSGYIAVSAPLNPNEAYPEQNNLFGLLTKPVVTANDLNDVDFAVDRFFNVLDQYESTASTVDLSDVQLIESVEAKNTDMEHSEIKLKEVEQQIVEVTAKELARLEYPVQSDVETHYVEPLNAYSFDRIEKMRTAEIEYQINLDKLWPQSNIKDHLESGHQRLDTLLLAKTLRDGMLVKEPIVKDDSTLKSEALAFSFFVSEMHGAVSKSRTVEDLLVKFDKAYTNVINMQPEYFSRESSNRELNTQSAVFNAFKKASHEHVVNGLPAREALDHLKDDLLDFKSLYDDNAYEIGLTEKLYVGEKPFVHYLNGFTLNATGESVNALSSILIDRMGDDRKSTLIDLSAHQVETPVVHKDFVNSLEAKTPINFNVKANIDELQSKWGIDFSVVPHNAHLTQGYAAIVDSALESIHEKLPSNLTSNQIGRGLSICGGIPHDSDQIKDIHISDIAGGKNGSNDFFANRYTSQLVKRLERAETNLMTAEEKSQFSGVKEEFKGLVAMHQKFGYEPKTEAGKALLSIHNSLISGLQDVAKVSPVAALLEHSSLVVGDKKRGVDKNVITFDSDFTGAYAKHFVTYMESRQDAAIKNIADKMAKLQGANQNANDMYHLAPTLDMLDKISNSSTISSKSAIDKFIQEVHGKNTSASKESMAQVLSSSISEKPESILQAQDYLASRAADKFINLLNQYAPESIKGNTAFIENVERYFGSKLGENIQVEKLEYASEYGHAKEMEHKNALINESLTTPESINADRIVFDFMNDALNGQTFNMKPEEKQHALELYAQVLLSHDVDQKQSAEAVLTKTAEKRNEESVELNPL